MEENPMSALTDSIDQNSQADNQYYPAGVPSDYSWYAGATPGSPPPANYSATTGWAVIEQEQGAPASANANATVTVSDFETWVLLTNGTWVEVQNQPTDQISGGNYSADFSTNNSTPLTITVNSDGSATMAGPPSGENDHIYPTNRGTFTAGSVEGVFVEANISASPGSELVAQLGADWWQSASAPYPDNTGAAGSNAANRIRHLAHRCST
jgi:hypothetical protein